MGYDISVLRAILRMANKRFPVTVSAIHLRVRGTEADVEASLARLARASLVTRSGPSLSLTLEGLAVAVATLPPIKQRARKPVVRAA